MRSIKEKEKQLRNTKPKHCQIRRQEYKESWTTYLEWPTGRNQKMKLLTISLKST